MEVHIGKYMWNLKGFHSLCTPLPLNEWLESNHWHQWFNDGFWSGKPLVAMVLQWFWFWYQWIFDGFVVLQPLDPMVFQWFPIGSLPLVQQWIGNDPSLWSRTHSKNFLETNPKTCMSNQVSHYVPRIFMYPLLYLPHVQKYFLQICRWVEIKFHNTFWKCSL